jgi:hypothetical protein
MSKKIINVGTGANTKDGDSVRLAFIKVNENFTDVYDTLNALAGGNAELIETSIKGSVYSKDGILLLSGDDRKLTTAAVPANVPLMYSFNVSFQSNGNLGTVLDLPEGWDYVKDGNFLIVTHNTQRLPKVISYWGKTAIGTYQLRYPTGGYQVIRNETIPSEFTLNLIAAATGADNSESALITVLF